MTEVLVLVEGQTEETFVQQVFAPDLAPKGVYLTPTVLTTKRVAGGSDYKGGVSSWGHIEGELQKLLRGAGPRPVTTFFDLYGFPADSPGFTSSGSGPDRSRAISVAVEAAFGATQLRFYVQPFEIEALVMAGDPSALDSRDAGLAAHVQSAVVAAGGPNTSTTGRRPRPQSAWPSGGRAMPRQSMGRRSSGTPDFRWCDRHVRT